MAPMKPPLHESPKMASNIQQTRRSILSDTFPTTYRREHSLCASLSFRNGSAIMGSAAHSIITLQILMAKGRRIKTVTCLAQSAKGLPMPLDCRTSSNSGAT